MIKENDYIALNRFLSACKYDVEQLDYVKRNFGKKNVLCVLREIYASMGVLEQSENEYMKIFNLLKIEFDLGCNILEIGGGSYPVLASYIDRYQHKIGKGTITVIDPAICINKLGNVKLVKEKFNFGDDISKYDLIVSQSPCLKIDEFSAAAIEKNKSFFVTLCNCILERYPNLVDYYYDDESFDPIFEQLLSEMKVYNSTLKNNDLQIGSGSVFYDEGEIKYFVGKKLIKR